MAFTYTGQKVDLGFGRGWLNTAPAASIRRIDRQIGHPLQITEAGRNWEQQNKHWLHYQRYGSPIAIAPWVPSEHQKGLSIDSDEAQRIIGILEDHGWRRTVYRWVNGKWTLVERWHFEHFTHLDNHRYDPEPTPAPAPAETGADDMRVVEDGKGQQMFMDELGADPIVQYFYAPNGWTGTPSGSENILASWALGDQEKPDLEVGWRFELMRHQANARWAQKRSEIVKDVVTSLRPFFEELGEALAGLTASRVSDLITEGLQSVAPKVEPLSAEVLEAAAREMSPNEP